jgi:hypothetical protein
VSARFYRVLDQAVRCLTGGSRVGVHDVADLVLNGKNVGDVRRGLPNLRPAPNLLPPLRFDRKNLPSKCASSTIYLQSTTIYLNAV